MNKNKYIKQKKELDKCSYSRPDFLPNNLFELLPVPPLHFLAPGRGVGIKEGGLLLLPQNEVGR